MTPSVHTSSPRVALVSGGLPMGGSTTFLLNLGDGLVRRGVPVKIFNLRNEHPLRADFQRQNVPVSSLDERPLIFEDRLRSVLRKLARFQPTVVVATLDATSFETLRYAPQGVFRAGMGQSHDPIVYEMMRRYAPVMDVLAVVSKEMQRCASAMPDFAGTPVHYLPYGVPIPKEENMVRRQPDRPLRVLYLGRLGREQKRVHLFPEILGQLKLAGIPFQWTVAGDGPEKAALGEDMKSAPGQSISFPGPVSYANVPELLRTHDIYLLASDYEGLPLSLLEAMGAGLVPVVSDLPSGIPEVVDDTTGMLVPVNDVTGYARAIIQLHEHRDELAAKSAAARKRVQREFSVEAMTDRWLAAFPSQSLVPAVWPSYWRILPPLTNPRNPRFWPPVRALRRLGAKFRK